MKRWIIIIIILITAAAVGYGLWRMSHNNTQQDLYETVKVEKGSLRQTVRASGTIQPVKLVQVGTQVTGPVQKLYVDFNTPVKADQVIAQIAPDPYQAKVAQDRANMESAKANVEQVRAKLEQAQKELVRDQELTKMDLVSQSELDAAVASRDALAAQLKLSKATVEQTKAALSMSETNLDYTTIHSPVDGIVVSRNVDEGQTLVASFASQTMFTIATDLKQMQVNANIPEADIGKISMGQTVTFTVDAYPYQDFQGTVSQIRIASATQQNVVTYQVIINADNPEQKLLPGMTANIIFDVAYRENVLKVPNAALRFKPEINTDQEKNAGVQDNTEVKDNNDKLAKEHKHEVWLSTGNGPKPVVVGVGISDGSYTEIESDKVKEGDEVIIALTEKAAKGDQKKNPFMPQFPPKPGGKKGKK